VRLFTGVVSTLFTVIGIVMIVEGDSDGWLVAGFFGLALLIAAFEPFLPKPELACDYRLSITEDEIACIHPHRPREAIRWEDVDRIWYVTTSGGPRNPDEWILLEGESRGCSFPTEVEDMDAFWDELKRRFVGFDYGPLIRGGTVDARHLCWERPRPAGSGA